MCLDAWRNLTYLAQEEKLKKHICEVADCGKTGTVRIRNGHYICEDHAKCLRRLKRSGAKPKYFFKEVLVGHVGEFDICRTVAVKL